MKALMLNSRRNRKIGATLSWNGQFTLDCSTVGSLPGLTFTLSGHNFTIGPHGYVVQTEGTCISAFVPVDIVAETELVFLGNVFLRRWYSVYDFGASSIGLAKAK